MVNDIVLGHVVLRQPYIVCIMCVVEVLVQLLVLCVHPIRGMSYHGMDLPDSEDKKIAFYL